MFLSQQKGERMKIPPRSAEYEEKALSELQFKSNKFVSGGTERFGEPEPIKSPEKKTEEKPPFELFKSIFGDDEDVE